MREKFSLSFFFHLKVQFFTSNVPDLLRHSSCYFDVDCETVFTQRRGRERGTDAARRREDLVTCRSRDDGRGRVYRGKRDEVCVWTPLGRTASTVQIVMVMLMRLNRMWVWEKGGVLLQRGRRRKQEEGWNNVVIVISGHHITPWYSQ